jgi:hypothetical protein
MKKKDIDAKSGSYSHGAKSGVCKDFKDIYKILDLIQDGQNSIETLQNNGNVEIEVKKEIGDE